MQTRVSQLVSALAMGAVAFGVLGCSDPSEEAKKLAEKDGKKLMDKKRGDQKVEVTKVAVEGSVTIPCEELFNAEPFTAALGEKVPVVMRELDRRNRIKRQPGMNAICEMLRGGERPSRDQQKAWKKKHKTERLGVLPGDPICEIRVDCSRPEVEDWENKCLSGSRQQGHKDLGVFACVRVGQMAERDTFRYMVYEPDSKCYLDVLGGPSVAGDEIPRACMKLAIDQITEDTIAKYKKN